MLGADPLDDARRELLGPAEAALDPGVPTTVAGAYAEGVRCLSANAPNGAVAMFRTALSYIIDDKGSDDAKAKKDLKEKISCMVVERGLTAVLGEWTTHIRLYSNAVAHPDLFGSVSVPEAQDVAKLIVTLLEILYTIPANIKRRQVERRP